MSRKPHLVAMTNKALEEYRIRLRMEQASVLAEIGLRAQLDDWSDDQIPEPLFLDEKYFAPEKD